MQHKRHHSRRWIFLLLFLAAVGIGAGVLMTRTIPAPQNPVEKQLDAKAFLETRQP